MPESSMPDPLQELSLSLEPPREQMSEQLRGLGAAILVGLGGTGAEVLRRVKNHLRWQRIEHLFRMIVIDTDSSSLKGTTGLPGFDDSEYCHLAHNRMLLVVKNPQMHEATARRTDLMDDSVLRAVRGQLEHLGEDEGCGQIRPIGALRFAANYQTFAERVDAATQAVLGLWGPLTAQLKGLPAHQVQEAKLPVFLVGSLCGGTGSSMLIDTIAALRHQLGDEVSIRCYLTMPSVYFSKLTQDQRQRVEANAYATLREIEYFQQGLARSEKWEFHYVGAHQAIPSPEVLFSRCYIVERRDARGADLQSPERIYDAMAMAIFSEVGLPIGQRLRSDLANQAAIDLANPDRETGLPRYYSTIGATAVAIPGRRLVEYGTFRATRHFLGESVLGAEARRDEVNEAVGRWLVEARIDDRSDASSHLIIAELNERIGPNIIGRVDRLFTLHRNKRQHNSDKSFMRAFEDLRRRWQESELDPLRSRLREEAQALGEQSMGKLESDLRAFLATKGIRFTRVFCGSLQAVLSTMRAELDESAKQARDEAAVSHEQAESAAEPMRGFFGSLGTDERAQQRTAAYVEHAMTCDFDAGAMRGAQAVIASLDKSLAAWSDRLLAIEESLCKAYRVAEDREGQAISATREVFADSGVEISLLSPEETQRLCGENMPGPELIKDIVAALGGGEHMAAYENREFPGQLVDACKRHYIGVLARMNAAEELCRQLEDKRAAGRARTIISEALKACRPLWRAESAAAQALPESVVVGVPMGENTSRWRRLREVIDGLRQAMSIPGYVLGAISMVQIEDPRKIYITRRSHGARPHYLPDWREHKAKYDSLKDAAKGLSLHAFPAAIARSLPDLEPDLDHLSNLAFALGMAFGWIAKRGQWYYYNLQRREESDGRIRFDAPLISQWNGVATEKGALRQELGVLTRPVESGALHYGGGKADPRNKLGQGREVACKELVRDQNAIYRLREIYDLVQQEAGTIPVADCIEKYAESMLLAVNPGDELREMLEREAKLLYEEAKQLRKG